MPATAENESDDDDLSMEGGGGICAPASPAPVAPSVESTLQSQTAASASPSATSTATTPEPLAKKGGKKNAAIPTGHFYCKYSLKTYPVSEQAPSYQAARWAKQAVDAIRRLAMKQGEKDYWAQLNENPKTMCQAIHKYSKCCLAMVGRGGKRSKHEDGTIFKIVELREYIKASSSTVVAHRGRLMWEEQCIAWAGTLDGNMLPRSVAQENWNQWKNLIVKALPGAPRSGNGGPVSAPLQIHIHMYDDIDTLHTIEVSVFLFLSSV